jgi:hypothetical protein
MLNTWQVSPAEVIWTATTDREPKRGICFLKAFHGAPCWSKAELELFKNAFSTVGLEMGNNQRIKASDLRRVGVLGEA